jgi:hypothetical protein
MLQGMFGQRLAEHFSLLESSSIVLGPRGNSQVALTRMRMPNGFSGPTPHIPPEKSFSISLHLRRPDSVKGWGTWLDGRFHRVTEWDAAGFRYSIWSRSRSHCELQVSTRFNLYTPVSYQSI